MTPPLGQSAHALLDQLTSDVGFVVRSLARARAFTFTVIATLAIGIGVATAVFHLTAWVLFYDSPFPNGSELYAIGYKDKESPFVPVRYGIHFDAFREQTNVFTDYAAVRHEQANVVIDGEPAAAQVLGVSADTFRVLGLRPVLGRGFVPEEMVAGADNVVVISDLFWRRHFKADPNVVGRDVIINQTSCTVIGVFSPNQPFPPTYKGDVYRPLVYRVNPQNFFNPALQIIGRLRSGITPEQASAALAAVTVPPLPIWATDYLAGQQTVVTSLKFGAMDHSWVLAVAAILLFAIACLNAMNLMLVRLIGRERELSIRLAVGGRRGQIARLVVIESVGLALAAGVIVALITRWLFPPLFALINNDPAALYSTYLRWDAVGLIAGLAVLASLGVAIVPILRVTAGSIQTGLKASGSGAGESPRMASVRNLMVVAQAALAVILLAGTGLMMRTFQKLHRVDLGFNPVGKVKVWVTHPRGQEKPSAQRLEYFEQLRLALSKLPGVRSAAYGQDSLVVGAYYGTAELLMKDGSFRPIAASFVSPDYLKTAGLTLMRGEWYSGQRGPIVAVINESMARQRFGDEDPLGQFFSIKIAPQVQYRVIGVVRDVRHSARAAPGMHYYVPDWMYPPNTSTVLLQLDRDPPPEFTELVRRTIYKRDPTAIIAGVASINEVVGNSMAAERYTYLILRGLAGIALALAAIGLFSVVTYTVHARTREFGIRLALGAEPAHLHALVLKRGVSTVAIGVALGLLAAFGLTRFMQKLLFETTPYDPPVYLAVVTVLLIAAIAACWLPARRAARVDPMTALRSE